MVNVELLELTLDWLREHPKQWDQNVSIAEPNIITEPLKKEPNKCDSLCGSRFCMAGAAFMIAGKLLHDEAPQFPYVGPEYHKFVIDNDDTKRPTINPSDFAKLLGISYWAADKIYYEVGVHDFDRFEKFARTVIIVDESIERVFAHLKDELANLENDLTHFKMEEAKELFIKGLV